MIERLQNLNGRQKTGAFLFVLSTLLWLVIPVIPFLSLELGTKAGVGIAVFIAAEVTGYAGLALLGKETVQLMKAGLRQALASLKGKQD